MALSACAAQVSARAAGSSRLSVGNHLVLPPVAPPGLLQSVCLLLSLGMLGLGIHLEVGTDGRCGSRGWPWEAGSKARVKRKCRTPSCAERLTWKAVSWLV